MIEVLYTTKAGRLKAIEEHEALGMTMKYDNFDMGPNGENQLVFETPVVEAPSDRTEKLKALRKKLSRPNNWTLSEVEELLRLMWSIDSE